MSTWAVIGEHPWGAALVKRLARAGHEALHAPGRGRASKRTRTPAAALAEAERVVLATDAAALEPLLDALAPHLEGHHRLLLLAGGVTPETHRLPSEAVEERTCVRQIAVAAGAADATALGGALPAALVVGSAFPHWARDVQSTLADRALRVYTLPDTAGVELAAALAGPCAVALGAARGLGLGAATEATALTRALAEMERLVTRLGGRPGTAHGLAGLGVLAADVLQGDAEPFRLGVALAQGALPSGPEPLRTLDALAGRAARAGVDAPLLVMVSALLRGEVTAADALERLMTRAPKAE
jgi:glycerol-3-phosphate dehydrogenase (NAD(P)+)